MAFTEYLIGKKETLAWVDETSYATGGDLASDGEYVGLNATMEPNFNQNWQDILTAGSASRTIEGRVAGPLAYPFTLTFTPVNWKFLKYCGYSVTDTTPGAYNLHTFALADTIQSFKLEWAKNATTSVVYTLTGCFVKSATINFSKATGEGEGMITVTLNCVAKSVTDGSTAADISAITTDPFQWRHTKFTFAGSEVTEVNNGEITINNGVDENDSRYCNATANREISEPIPKTHRINGRVNINVADNTYFDEWETADEISGTNKLEFIKTATSNQLTLDMSGFRISTANEPTNFEGVNNVDLVYTAESFSTITATDSLDY